MNDNHACTDECTPDTCAVQHDLEFGGPELRAAEKFERDTLADEWTRYGEPLPGTGDES